jgi:5-formaminoimidazole-4-carboxamide-1-beta-D-ribofuranosyl 5'-monophosphate synthetase
MRQTLVALALFVPAAFAATVANDGKAREFSHSLKAGGIAEECLRLEPGRSRTFEWNSDAPVDFNIHFHKGDEVTYPVKADGRSKGRGRFTAATGEDYCWMWTARDATRVTGKLGAEE